jgi:hypothetical protein
MIPPNTEIETAVAEALEPFSEEVEVEAYRVHLDRVEVRRMAKHYNVDPADLHELAKKLPDWVNREGGVDRQGLYCFSTFNPDGRWDWYEIGGRWSGYIPRSRDNCMVARTLAEAPYLKDCLPNFLLTPDGQWLEHERYYFSGDWKTMGQEEMKEEGWLSLVRGVLLRWPTHRVVCVDIHC